MAPSLKEAIKHFERCRKKYSSSIDDHHKADQKHQVSTQKLAEHRAKLNKELQLSSKCDSRAKQREKLQAAVHSANVKFNDSRASMDREKQRVNARLKELRNADAHVKQICSLLKCDLPLEVAEHISSYNYGCD